MILNSQTLTIAYNWKNKSFPISHATTALPHVMKEKHSKKHGTALTVHLTANLALQHNHSAWPTDGTERHSTCRTDDAASGVIGKLFRAQCARKITGRNTMDNFMYK